jgi:hypothetical protein
MIKRYNSKKQPGKINLLKSEVGSLISSEHKPVRVIIENAVIFAKDLQPERM